MSANNLNKNTAIVVNEKIGKNTEYKIKISVKDVENTFIYFLEKYNIDKKVQDFFDEEFKKLTIDFEQIKINCKLRTQKNYKKQFDINFYNLINEYVEKLVIKYSNEYLTEVKETKSKKEFEELKLIINNTFEEIGMTMFDENLNRIKIISFHYLLKNAERYAIKYTEILNIKMVRGHSIPIEIFRYELIDIISNTHDLTMFTVTLKSLIEQWVIKYNRRTKIGQFYFDVLMSSPELMVERILRSLIFTSIKNKNPITLRAIFSTYVSLIHTNINSYYASNLTKVKVGHFSQLNSLFSETSNEQLNNFHNISQLIVITRAKNFLNANKKLYKENYDIINDNDINEFLDINYQDFVSGYRSEINLLDYYYIYNKFLKNTNNGFSKINSNIKLKTKYMNTSKKNTKDFYPYIFELVINRFQVKFLEVVQEQETVNELCRNITETILKKLFPKGFLDINFKMTIQSYEEYINDIIRLINGFEKIFKGEKGEI